jgi:hypothetical protein
MPRTRPRKRPATRALLATAEKHVVYVHGICRHDPGFSKPWFAAMKPYVGDIQEENCHEVLWSDIVHPTALASMARAQIRSRAVLNLMHPKAPEDGEPDVMTQIKDFLADRAQQQFLEANLRSAGPGQGTALMRLPTVAPQAMFSIPALECVDDFADYLRDRNVRDQVIDRFHQVVRPLLGQGARLHVISHSWGTVVAYEGLRLLDGENVGEGIVHNFFTVGSALAIPPVKHRLIAEAMDGARPRLVQNWVNLDAHFDIVGGPLQGVPFAVDQEFLGLEPIGCSAIFPNPVCAHGSYFNMENVPVNRDIFGRFIGS